jgi:hypothetical protein
MQLNSIRISKSAITLKVTANKDTDEDVNDIIESTITAQEAPLDSLTKAWDKLREVFCALLEITETDAKGKPKYPYSEGLTVTKLSILRTKLGTRSVVLEATKQLECRRDFLHTLKSPCVQVDHAADGESGGIELDKKLAEIVTQAIHEAERYMGGERSQQLLDFDKAKAGLQAIADQGKDDMFASQ